MRHPERVEDYLGHIAQAIERAGSYLQPLPDFEAFQNNQQVQDAVVRNIEIIGEAVNKINGVAPDLINQHPELPWAQMRAMCNVIVHEYFFVDLKVVWTTIKDDLPRLKQQIDALLNEQQPTLAERFGQPVTRQTDPGPEPHHERDDDREL
jgi:uncharacterized protein with HEPN domain